MVFLRIFYQVCWDIIKADLIKVFVEFYDRGVISKGMNATFIAPVPKKEEARDFSNFRPISLVSSLYKIVSKVLCLRMRLVINEIVFHSQGAFVRGRQIVDGILVANELVDDRKRSRKPGLVWKIDMKKVYDRMDWDFLRWVLTKKGFGVKWIEWIMGCLFHPHLSILINGMPKGFFGSFHGHRQGDPLSPFLFTLVTDAFSALMVREEEVGIIDGFKAIVEGPVVSHLQFANDIICFVDADVDQVSNLKSIMGIYECISGLKVNLSKSYLAGIGVDGSLLTNHAEVFWCKLVEWPLKYLGMPLEGNSRSISFWDPVVKRVLKKLEG